MSAKACPFCGAANDDSLEGHVQRFQCGTLAFTGSMNRDDQTPQCITAEVARLTRERDELQAWKDSAMAVEAEWDPQAVARVLGLPLGVSVRAEILPGIRKLAAERDEARLQQKYGWDRAADNFRAYESALKERDEARAMVMKLMRGRGEAKEAQP